MDQEKGLVLHHVSLADNHNLERAGELITQLHREGGLPEDETANDEMLKNLDLQEEHTTLEQFVFHGQCLVLGDSGVGKTSLVKSLTGKSFDPRQPKTQGIDQCLVDGKWKTLSMKDLILGNLLWCYETISVQLTLYGTANPRNILLRSSINWRNTCPARNILLSVFFYFACLLFSVVPGHGGVFLFSIPFLFLVFHFVLLYVFNCNYNFRLIVTTFFFAARPRGLLIGAFLAFIRVLYHYGKFSVNADGILLMTIIEVLVPVLLILYFGIKWHCPYPRQLKFKYHRSLEVVCFVPLLVSVLVGYISFLAVVSFLLIYSKGFGRSVKRPNEFVKSIMSLFFLWWTYELGNSAVKSRGIFKVVVTFNNTCTIKLILFISFSIQLYMYMYTYMCFDSIMICVFLSDTIFREWQDIQKLEIKGNAFTAVVIEKQELNKAKLKSALKKKFSSLKLRILDFAGDKEYYAYHHMFLRSDAIYIIAFNMAEFAENDFKEIDAKCKGLQFWFDSVCSHVPPSTPIFLVGTHRGNMGENCIKIISRHLRTYLWDRYCDELVANDDGDLIFFPVENSDGQNDIGVQCLQKQIVSFAEQRKKTIACSIPLSWIRIQDAIIGLREKKVAKFCVTLNEFPAVFDTPDNFICTNWSEKTVKYFHKNGLVIYLDRKQETTTSNWVLLKPEILVDIIIQLVTPSPENVQERGSRRHWKRLQKKGLLTKSLLSIIIAKQKENEEAMTTFLEEYDLICPLETCNLSDEQPTHFVPSLLPMSADEDTPIWYDDDTDKKCYVFFTRFLPEPLFHRLLSRAHKLSKLEYPNGQTVLFRDAGKFWISVRQPYCLKLMKEEKMIEVTFSCR